MNRLPIRPFLFLALLTIPLCSGCFTLSGFGLGAVLDATATDSVSITGREALALQPGRTGILVCSTGTVGEVVVLEAAFQRDEDYGKRYLDWNTSRTDTVRSPELNALLSVWIDEQPVRRMRFCGFDGDGVWLRRAESGRAFYAAFAGITAIEDQERRVWGRADLERFVTAERAPFRSGILVRPLHSRFLGSSERAFVPERFVSASDIVELRMQREGNRSLLYALAGFGADVIAFYVLKIPSKISK